jgi:hypothetical protein
MNDTSFALLAELLHRRLEVIADISWRDRDSASHLLELQRVSECINAEHIRLSNQLPPKLKHYFQQSSYQKALAFIEGDDA